MTGASEDDKKQNTNILDEAVSSSTGLPVRTSSLAALAEKLSSSVCLKWMILISLPLLILYRYPVDRIDYDLWWQMAHGKYYLTHHTLRLDLSVFSWTPTDPTWIYNTCLGSIVIYLFYHWMNGFGLWLCQWLVLGGVFGSYYAFLRVLKQRLDIGGATVIAAIAVACSISCRYYKPELFSALLFSWAAFLFFYIKIRRQKYLFYIYPLIFVLWVNLHGAFIMGLALLGMAFVGELLNRFFFPRESMTTNELTHFAVAGVLSGAATLINPYGIQYLISLFPIAMSAMGYQSYANPYDKYVLAYAGLWPYLKTIGLNFYTVGLTTWIMTFMLFAVVTLSVYELVKKRSFDFTLLIVSAGLYWKGMDTSRASYFFPIAFFFILYYLIVHRLSFRKWKSGATLFAVLVFIFFFAVTTYYNKMYWTDNQWFGRAG